MTADLSRPLPPLPDDPLVVRDVLDLIGQTSLVEIELESNAERAQLFGKLEAANPGGSVKDRICLEMILDAERSGRLQPGGTLVEPTSGNTGVGLAVVCARRGYRCILTMPESMSLERRQLLEALGAEVILTPAEAQMSGALEKARELLEATPGAFMPQQFENPSNPRVHERNTGPEILSALAPRRVDAFVAGVGTGGTITGVARALKSAEQSARIIAVEPESCATLSRGERGPTKIQGLAAGFVPKNYDRSLVDEIRTVTDAQAFKMRKRLAEEQGLLVGLSSGAAVAVALDVAREVGPEGTVVTVLPDTGERYFSLDPHFKGRA